jgi:Arc/MetJ-type ribon-helix-helix transcriptional regulator
VLSFGNAFEIKIRPTVQIAAYLDELIRTGLYGNSRAEAAISLIQDQIKQLRKEGEFKKRKI